jgi:hypothetical protein
MARALRVLVPDHNVAFAALGAEVPSNEGGAGSLSLARFLTDEDLEPVVIRLQVVSLDPHPHVFSAYKGELAETLNRLSCDLSGRQECFYTLDEQLFSPDPLADAGFEHTLVTGNSEGISNVLLTYLGEHGR